MNKQEINIMETALDDSRIKPKNKMILFQIIIKQQSIQETAKKFNVNVAYVHGLTQRFKKSYTKFLKKNGLIELNKLVFPKTTAELINELHKQLHIPSKNLDQKKEIILTLHELLQTTINNLKNNNN